MFLRFGGSVRSLEDLKASDRASCGITLTRSVEYVVDETYSRLRFLSGYSRRLKEPVAAAIRHIDALVEEFPEAILCSRSTFSTDPRVGAFFVDPGHLQQVFSQSAQVQDLFDKDPSADDCWALLCLRKEERQRLGVSLVGDAVRKEVMQTVVNFIDHQVLSPAVSEAEARCSLKCCIFNGMLAHIRKQASADKIRVIELENRRNYLAAHLSRAVLASGDASREELKRELDDISSELAREIPRLASLEYYFGLAADVLGKPERYVSSSLGTIHLTRLGIKADGDSAQMGNKITLYEVDIASHGTRVAALVRFRRSELLPRPDFVRKADFFVPP